MSVVFAFLLIVFACGTLTCAFQGLWAGVCLCGTLAGLAMLGLGGTL